MSHREDSANDALVGIRKELENGDLHKELEQRLATTLKKPDCLHVKKITFIDKIDKELKQSVTNNANTDSVLTGVFKYTFNPKFTAITGTLQVNLYPTCEKLQKLANTSSPLEAPILKFTVMASEEIPNFSETMEENAKLWSANNYTPLKTALQNILDRIIRKLGNVLQQPSSLPEV